MYSFEGQSPPEFDTNFAIKMSSDTLIPRKTTKFMQNSMKGLTDLHILPVISRQSSSQSSVRKCHKMTNCEQFRQNAVKNSSFHRCLFNKNGTRMLQQEGIRSVIKNIFFVGKGAEIL